MLLYINCCYILTISGTKTDNYLELKFPIETIYINVRKRRTKSGIKVNLTNKIFQIKNHDHAQIDSFEMSKTIKRIELYKQCGVFCERLLDHYEDIYVHVTNSLDANLIGYYNNFQRKAMYPDLASSLRDMDKFPEDSIRYIEKLKDYKGVELRGYCADIYVTEDIKLPEYKDINDVIISNLVKCNLKAKCLFINLPLESDDVKWNEMESELFIEVI